MSEMSEFNCPEPMVSEENMFKNIELSEGMNVSDYAMEAGDVDKVATHARGFYFLLTVIAPCLLLF